MKPAKILVPVDGSELSDRILAQVRRILVREDAEVILVRVVTADALSRERESGSVMADARNHLDRLVRELEEQGARASAHVLCGDPAEKIVEHALTERALMIAMATHGRSGIARWVRGSTAERVLRTSTTPLLLANPLALDHATEVRFQKILVPLDGSDGSATILPLAAEIAKLYGAELILQHVIEIPPLEYPVSSLTMTNDEAQTILRGYAARVSGVRVRTTTSVGSPAHAILELVEQERVDLVAMTTHGRTGSARWAFGSVAENVVRHARCPLLVQRSVSVDLPKTSSKAEHAVTR